MLCSAFLTCDQNAVPESVTCFCAGVDWKVVGKYCDVSRSYKTFQNPNDESSSAPKSWRATFLHLLTLPGIIPQSVSKLPGKLWRTVSGREKDMKLGKNFREGACLIFLHIAFHCCCVCLVALKCLQHACMNGCSSTFFCATTFSHDVNKACSTATSVVTCSMQAFR